MVAPGEIFSFNKKLGPTTLKSGFQIGFGITVNNGQTETVPVEHPRLLLLYHYLPVRLVELRHAENPVALCSEATGDVGRGRQVIDEDPKGLALLHLLQGELGPDEGVGHTSPRMSSSRSIWISCMAMPFFRGMLATA